jgi:hypothetical protein
MLSLHESPAPIATIPDLTDLWEAAVKKIARSLALAPGPFAHTFVHIVAYQFHIDGTALAQLLAGVEK